MPSPAGVFRAREGSSAPGRPRPCEPTAPTARLKPACGRAAHDPRHWRTCSAPSGQKGESRETQRPRGAAGLTSGDRVAAAAMFGRVRVRAPGPGCAQPWRRRALAPPCGLEEGVPQLPAPPPASSVQPPGPPWGWARGSGCAQPSPPAGVDFAPTLSALGRVSHQVSASMSWPL